MVSCGKKARFRSSPVLDFGFWVWSGGLGEPACKQRNCEVVRIGFMFRVLR